MFIHTNHRQYLGALVSAHSLRRNSSGLIDRMVVANASLVEVVSRHGVGYDNIDLAALTARRIPLAIAADANATAVAEHTLYFMLALAKQGLRYDRATREGRWAVRNSLEAVDLLGRRVLVMGFGRIGREVARRCAAFGMRVMVYDPYVQANVIEDAGDYRSVPDFEAALPETDVLTLHMPLGGELDPSMVVNREVL